MCAKTDITINFTGFWPSFNKTDNFFFNLLSKKYNVSIGDKPDILFFAESGNEHIKYNCTKVFYTGENQRPDFGLCDYSFCFDYPVTDRNYRLPLYALWGDMTELVGRKPDIPAIVARKTKFCCFVISNAACQTRNIFFEQLSKYKQVDSGGRAFNNIGGAVADKLEFIKDYKFVISFENSSYPGYTTEKIYEPFVQHCIPIYWGNPLVHHDFNPASFVNSHDFASMDEVIKRIVEIDNNDELFADYLRQPAFLNDELNPFVNEENILKRLDEIVAYHRAGKFGLRRFSRPLYFYYKMTRQAALHLHSKSIPSRAARKIYRLFIPK